MIWSTGMAITSSLGWLSSQKARRQQPFPSAILIVFVNWILLFFHLNLRYLFSNQITLDSSWKNWVGFRWASHFHAIAFLINIKTTVIDWNGCYLFAWLTLFRFFYEHHCGWRKWFYFFTQLCATQNSFKSKKSFSSAKLILLFN